MVNAISGQNFPVLNFAYHLPKLWSDRFVDVNGKQPRSIMTPIITFVALTRMLKRCP